MSKIVDINIYKQMAISTIVEESKMILKFQSTIVDEYFWI